MRIEDSGGGDARLGRNLPERDAYARVAEKKP